MEHPSIAILLRDLRSVKLPPAIRETVDKVRERFESGISGSWDVGQIRSIQRRYSVQLEELWASRERARATLWRRRENISLAKSKEIVGKRVEEQSRMESELGF